MLPSPMLCAGERTTAHPTLPADGRLPRGVADNLSFFPPEDPRGHGADECNSKSLQRATNTESGGVENAGFTLLSDGGDADFSRVPMSPGLTQADENRLSACALLAAWESCSQRRGTGLAVPLKLTKLTGF
jgi:hypothetical protein